MSRVSTQPRPAKRLEKPLLAPRLRVLFVTTAHRTGGWLADSFVGECSSDVALEETIGAAAEGECRYIRQTGGRGQYGHVKLRVAPAGQDEGLVFENRIVGGAIPGRFIPAVEKGIRESMGRGAIAGYKMVDFKCTLFDGSFHTVDSSEAAFKMAGSMAYREAARDAKPTILEPYMTVRIVIPQDYLGDVMGDVSSRRGRVQGMEADGGNQVINAQIPAAEMGRYAMDLRSMTQGRGQFERAFSHYEELPRDLQEKVIAASKAEEEVAR